MPSPFRHHPIYGLPFDATIANELEREYRQMSPARRFTSMRKVVQRELLLRLTGQSQLRVAHAPLQARRVLWIYPWTTVGDSLMDLAVRTHLPANLQFDLLIEPSLAPLYVDDPRWNKVHARVEDCDAAYDFVLLQDLSTKSLKLKARLARSTPFATVFGHLRGECFDRMSFAQRRMEQIFGIEGTGPAAQSLHMAARGEQSGQQLRVAVALGARDPRRTYGQWPQVLQAVVDRWPAGWPTASLVLMGNQAARQDLALFAPAFLARHCHVEIGQLDLRGVAASITACDAFVGADGGLMHIAVALDKPGAALFVEIDPRLRLLPSARMRSLFTPHDIDCIHPADVAKALLAALAQPHV